MEPLACVVHGIEESNIKVGDKVAVVGTGPIGLMFVKLAVLKGGYVIASDLSRERLENALKFGAREIVEAKKGMDQAVEIKKRTEGGKGVDVAIEATGFPEVWEKTIKMVRKGGTVNLFGGCKSDTSISVDTALIHYHEITIKGVYHHTPYFVKRAFELIKTRTVDARQFITGSVPIEKLIEALEKIGRQEGIKYKIDVN